MDTNPFSKENRGARTLQQVKYPWSDKNPTCETWGPGGFHPMGHSNLVGPKSYMVGEIEEDLQRCWSEATDKSKTLKWRDHHRRTVEILVSHLAQILDMPGYVPEATGDEYKAWVKNWVDRQPPMTLQEREDKILYWREKTGNWPAHRCDECLRRGYEVIGTAACCKSYHHHGGKCCVHCGNDERNPLRTQEVP